MAEAKEMSFPITNSVTLKVGKGLYIDENGALSVKLAVAGNTLAEPGIAIFSANQFTVNENGMAKVKFATSSSAGVAYFPTECFTVASDGRVMMKGATKSTRGVVYLASENDVNLGTDDNKAVTPLGLAKRLATFKPTGTASTPTTLIGGGDTNAYPLNNAGTGAIAVWDAQNHRWCPSNVLMKIIKALDVLAKTNEGVFDALRSFDVIDYSSVSGVNMRRS